jgi:hypothetical protein
MKAGSWREHSFDGVEESELTVGQLDTINSLWEIVGGWLIWINVVRLWQHREVRGTSPLLNLFFFSWGVWNLLYYHQMNQPWSFLGQTLMVSGYLTWCGLYFFLVF